MNGDKFTFYYYLGVENNRLEYGVFPNVQKETFGQGLLEGRPNKLTILEIW